MSESPGKANAFTLNAVEVYGEAGASVRRLFPTLSLRYLDPFVVLDEVDVAPDAALDPYSQRGFEALTYVLDGSFLHHDNLGQDCVVEAGSVQRVTHAKGTSHSQTPQPGARNHGVQLWLNLPGPLDEVQPSRQQLVAEEIPEWSKNGVTVRTVAGEGSPIELMTPIRYLDIQMTKGVTHTESIPADWNGFAYVLSGRVRIGDVTLEASMAALHSDGTFVMNALDDTRLLLIAGRPHGMLGVHQVAQA
jgi:redox-sensitive bicupin YhaK (pirin superfamily)